MAVIQTNTFLKGMNMDADITMIGNDLYRYAENIRINTNNGGTTGPLLNIEGVYKYATFIDLAEVIIGTATVSRLNASTNVNVDTAIIFTKVVDSGGLYLYNKVYRVDGFDTTSPVNTVILKGYLNLCTAIDSYTLSIVSNYETESNVKVYFTDGNSSIKLLNVVDDKYVGTSATNTNVDANGFIVNPLILDITPGAILFPLLITTLESGSLAAGVIQYCYQLFNVHSNKTTVSALSPLIHLAEGMTSADSKSYFGTKPNTSSGKSCVLKAELLNNSFQKCRIISVSYIANNTDPNIYIVDEIDLVAGLTYINYKDTGNTIIGEITVAEFNALTGSQFKAKTLAKLQNRLFAANTQEDSWNPVYDARAYRSNLNGLVTLNSANTNNNILFQFGAYLGNDIPSITTTHDCINPYNALLSSEFSPATDCVYSNEFTTDATPVRVMGGTGPNVSYTFAMVDLELETPTTIGTGARADLELNIEANTNAMSVSSKVTSKTHTIDFPVDTARIHNYADPYIAANYKSYQRDEIYRFGVILYNNKNVPSPVHWIGDIRMPHASEKDYSPFFVHGLSLSGTANTYRPVARALGLLFTFRNIPDDCYAFEIVRCDRTENDRTILTQSAISLIANYKRDDKNTSVGGTLEYRPFSLMTYTEGSLNLRADMSISIGGIVFPAAPVFAELDNELVSNEYCTMTSPEICFNPTSIYNLIGSDSYIDTIYGLASPITSGALSDPKLLVTAKTFRNYEGTMTSITDDEVYNKFGRYFYDSSLSDWVLHMPGGGSFVTLSKYYLPFINNITGSSTIVNVDKKTLSIKEVKIPANMPYNGIIDKTSYYCNIGDIIYLNFSSSIFAENSTFNIVSKLGQHGPVLVTLIPGLTTTVARFKTTLNTFSDNMTFSSGYTVPYSKTAILMANIKKAITPYGGKTYTSRLNSIYESTGSYKYILKLESDPLEEFSIDVFGGDTFLNVLDYPAMMQYQYKDAAYDNSQRLYSAAYIPFESSINLALSYGDMPHRTSRLSDLFMEGWAQTDITLIQDQYVQDRPFFVYNSVYSTLPGSRKFISASIYDEDNVRTTNRITCSELKTNNEVDDSWSTFKFANYLDVDNQYGQITNLKNFKDRLFFFLNSALGVASVNDRSLITDGNAGALTLGTGDILSRYDYLTTGNGTSTVCDKSIVNSDSVVYWYDFDKNEICSFDGNVSSLSKEKGVLTYLNELTSTNRKVLTSVYDKKYNEVLLRFNNKTLVFSEQLGEFTCFYTFNPNWALDFSDKTIVIKDNKYYRLNAGDTALLDNIDKTAKIQFIVNKDPSNTKTFDNVLIDGEFNDPNNTDTTLALTAKFSNKHLYTNTVLFNNIDYREDNYRFAIPREVPNTAGGATTTSNKSYTGRMRGKYLICDYTFDCNDSRTFKIPYITTIYRYSLI